MLSKVHSSALMGIEAWPAPVVVGMATTAVRESKDRVWAAIGNSPLAEAYLATCVVQLLAADTKELTIYIEDIYFLIMDTAKLFMNGRSQAVRLPKEYRFRGKRVYVRKVGKGVLLMPEEETWDTLIESTSQFTEDFASERNQGEPDNREGLFE